MRVWVRSMGHYYEVETEHADGSFSIKLCYTREDAKAYVDALRKEGNRKECQY